MPPRCNTNLPDRFSADCTQKTAIARPNDHPAPPHINRMTNIPLHSAYLAGIALKGLDGLLEMVGGALLLLTNGPAILHVTTFLVQGELAEDPHDFVATHALDIARHLSSGTLHLVSAYLLANGCIKIGLVTGLWRGWRGAYPATLSLLTAFIGYQCFRLLRFPSIWLGMLTGIDLAIVLLIGLEWRRIRRMRPQGGSTR